MSCRKHHFAPCIQLSTLHNKVEPTFAYTALVGKDVIMSVRQMLDLGGRATCTCGGLVALDGYFCLYAVSQLYGIGYHRRFVGTRVGIDVGIKRFLANDEGKVTCLYHRGGVFQLFGRCRVFTLSSLVSVVATACRKKGEACRKTECEEQLFACCECFLHNSLHHLSE